MQPRSALALGLRGLGALGVLALLIGKAVLRPLGHDEHQFVAPAVQWWREGLLPYVDYPHFHAPYSVYLNALPVALSDHLLLGVRLLSVLWAALFLVLLHGAVRATSRRAGLAHGALLADGAVLIAVTQPLFASTSALAWNHDNALLAAFAGVLAGAAALRRGVCGRRLVLSGALLAAAAGLRLSMAPAGLALVLGVTLCAPRERRVRAALLTTLGGVLGSLPFLAHLALAPDAAWFGNVEYAALNTAFREQQGFEQAMTLGGKLVWLKQAILTQPGALLLALATAYALLRLGPRGLAAARRAQPELVLALVLLPALWLAAFAATPAWPQYFFAPLVWLVPVAAWALAARGPARGVGWVLVTAGAFAAIPAVDAWRAELHDTRRGGQDALAAHAVGRELGALVGDGRVLTRAPILALEGGARVDPAFTSGPFAWRVASLLPPDERRARGLVGPDDVAAHQARHPAAAVLLLRDDEAHPLDTALDLAGWTEHALPHGAAFGLRLLVPPPADADR